MYRSKTLVWSCKQSASIDGYPIVLTQRQREVLMLLCEGLPNKVISRRLGISDATVKTHVASVLRSLNTATRLEAVTLAFQMGLVHSAQDFLTNTCGGTSRINQPVMAHAAAPVV
jgi:DNA-binding NarL/FixJ family response regulator